jgi:hypothetical protein
MKGVATWACGNNATIIKSTNSGDTWTNANQNGIPSNINLVNVHAVSALFALTAGYSGNNTYIYRTTNGGLAWQQVFNQPGGYINAINMITLTEGHAVGNPVEGRWSIWKTLDGGISWDSTGMYLAQSGNETGFANSFCSNPSGTTLWMGTNNYRIYKSADGGLSWSIASTAPEKDNRTLWFDYNITPGYSGGQTLIRTSNYGISWQRLRTYGTESIMGFTASAFARLSWFVRNNNRIYYSDNYWSPWELSYTAPAGNYRYITIERNGFFGGAVFAIRDNGGITRTFFLSIGINEISSEIPSSFSLSQNYPNPFNPATKFKFSVPSKSHITVKVYNSIGAEIQTLVNQELSPAVYEASWDASKYASGIYFYRLTTEHYYETRKMVLIK